MNFYFNNLEIRFNYDTKEFTVVTSVTGQYFYGYGFNIVDALNSLSNDILDNIKK